MKKEKEVIEVQAPAPAKGKGAKKVKETAPVVEAPKMVVKKPKK